MKRKNKGCKKKKPKNPVRNKSEPYAPAGTLSGSSSALIGTAGGGGDKNTTHEESQKDPSPAINRAAQLAPVQKRTEKVGKYFTFSIGDLHAKERGYVIVAGSEGVDRYEEPNAYENRTHEKALLDQIQRNNQNRLLMNALAVRWSHL